MKKIFAILLSVLISACSLGLVACDAQANDDAKFTVTTIYNLLKEEGWDGTYKGNPQPMAVYIYIVKFTNKNGVTATQKGELMLIR